MRQNLADQIQTQSRRPSTHQGLTVNPMFKPLCAAVFSALLCSGCAVVAVADAAVTVVATGVKVGAKTVGAVADAVIPDGD